MSGTLRVSKKAMVAGGGAEQGQNPEEMFKESVKQVALEYLKSKFPYILEYSGDIKVQKVDLDKNSMVMSYSLYDDNGAVLGDIPILFSNGKIIEPWAIFVTNEKSMKPLSKEWLAKLYDNAAESNGSITNVTDVVPGRAMYDNEAAYRSDTLTARNNRRYAALNRLKIRELSSIIQKSHKDAKLYMDAGRLATKIAATRMMKSKPVVSTSTTVILKKGCLAFSNIDELSHIKADPKQKKAALEDYYDSGKQEVFIFGEDSQDSFVDITEKVNETHKFESVNLYIDILANSRPVVCAINKDTGKEMFFIKRDSNEASPVMSQQFTMTREINKDDIVKRWNKPEHSLVAVAPLDWKEKYAELLEKEKEVNNKVVSDVVAACLEGKTSVAGGTGSKTFVFALVPEKPTHVSRGDYGYAVLMDVYKTPDGKGNTTFAISDPLFAVDIAKYEEGVVSTKKGERFYVIKCSETDTPQSFKDACLELSRRTSIFVDTPDNCFVTPGSQSMSKVGYSFLSNVLTLDDAAKLTMWVKKTGDNKFALGISQTVNDDGKNVIVPKSLGTVPRKTAGIVLGLAGKTTGLNDFLDNHPQEWHRYTSKSKSAFLRKLAQNPAGISQLLGDVVQQAKAMGGEEGVTINIENLHLAVPDLASGVAEGQAQSGETTSGETSVTDSVMQELMTFGVPQELIDKIMGLSEVTGAPAEDLLGKALEFVKTRTSEGVPIETAVSEMNQMADELMGQTTPAPAPAPAPAPEGQMVEAPGAIPPLPELINALLGLGITQQTVDMIQQAAPVMQMAPEQLIVEAGTYAEEAIQGGAPVEQVNADLQNNLQQMMQGTSPEMVQAAGSPVAQAAASVPMPAQQEQAMVQAGQQVTEAVPAPPAQTPVYDAVNRAAAEPGMEQYEEELNTTREGGLIADIIGNAVIKTKFMDYLPTLNDTMNTVAELILKIELAKSDLINDVGVNNVDKVLGDLRDVNQRIGNLILSIGSFE